MRSPVGSRSAAASSGLALAVHLHLAPLGGARAPDPAQGRARRPVVGQGRVRPRHPVGAPEGERHGRVVAEADEDGAARGGDRGIRGIQQQLGTGRCVEPAVEGAGERVQPAQQHGSLTGGRWLLRCWCGGRWDRRPVHGSRPRAEPGGDQGEHRGGEALDGGDTDRDGDDGHPQPCGG